MAYEDKGYDSETFYRFYQCHVGDGEALHKLNGLTRFVTSPVARYYSPSVMGALMPKMHAVEQAVGPQAMDTVGIGQLVTLGCGMHPWHFDGTGSPAAEMTLYWAAVTEHAGISDVGISMTIAEGLIHIQTLTARQNEAAVANCQIFPLWDGTNDALVPADVASLDTAVGSVLSTENEAWTFGGVTVDGTALKLATGFTMQGLPYVPVAADGSLFPQYGYTGDGQIVFTVDLEKPTLLSDLAPYGLAAFGSGTTPPVAATSAKFHLLRVDPYGTRKAADNGDIVILANFGTVLVGDVIGTPNGPMTNQVRFVLHDDADNSITFTKNADS